MQRSPLHREVLALYRHFLVACRGKDGLRDHVRAEFKRNAQIPLRESQRIEHHLRRAKRQLKLLQRAGTGDLRIQRINGDAL